MELLETIDTKTVKSGLDKYLVQAHEEDDEMWSDNLLSLAETLKIKDMPEIERSQTKQSAINTK